VQSDEAKQQTRWPYHPSETISIQETPANGLLAGRIHRDGKRQMPHFLHPAKMTGNHLPSGLFGIWRPAPSQGPPTKETR